MVCERPDELRADLMEVYDVCLDDAVRGAYPAPFVAALAEQLPQDCRWRVAYEPDCAWTLDRQLQAGLLNALNALIWGLADPKKRGPAPKPVGPKSAQGPRGRTLPAMAMTREQLMEELSKPRKAG